MNDQYGTASVIGDNRIVFNIAGNKYRLIVKFNCPFRVGYIRFIGTHAEYDNALARVAELMDSAPGSGAGAELDVLATLIDAYEASNIPIDPPDPQPGL